MPVYDATYEQPFFDAKGDSRTCLNCGRLVREASTRPDDAWFERTFRLSAGATYAGVKPRDRRHTARHADTVFCDACGTTDSHTLVDDPSRTLSIRETLDRADAVFEAVDELCGVPLDRAHARGVIKQVKRDPDQTTMPVDNLLAFAVGFGAQRAALRRARGTTTGRDPSE